MKIREITWDLSKFMVLTTYSSITANIVWPNNEECFQFVHYRSASRFNISRARGGTQPCHLYWGNKYFTVGQKLGKNPTLRVPLSWTFLSLLLISHLLSTHYNNFHAISAIFQTFQARSFRQCATGCTGSNVLRYKMSYLRIDFHFWAYSFP